MNTKIKILAIILLVLNITQPSAAKGRGDRGAELNSVTISLECADDAIPNVMQAIERAKSEGVSEIVFEQGVYHFYPEKAKERYCYISNHADLLSRIAFDIKGIAGLTINANGSTFIFHGRLIPFLITDSRDIRVENLAIDCADLFYSEGTVLATDTINKRIDIQFHKNSPYEIRNNEIVFVRPYYTHNLGQNLCFDPKTGAPIYRAEPCYITHWGSPDAKYGGDFNYKYRVDDGDEYLRWRVPANGLQAEEISPSIVRFTGQNWEMPPVGSILTCKGAQELNRVAPAFKCNGVENLKLHDVTVHHAGGMAFLFENCNNIDMYKCSVTPSEGRVISSTADATHFVGCRGDIRVQKCIFESQLDDAMNVHGAYQEVIDILGDNKLGVRVGHYQQLGFKLANAGDKVGIVRLSESFAPYNTLTVESTEFINGRYQIITFKENFPSRLHEGDLLENLSAYPKLLVEDCKIVNNRARGILISTPVGAIIRNNVFSTEMQAILLPVESGYWYESGSAANVVIEGNTFNDCGQGGYKYSVITFHTDDANSNIAFKDITIRGNTFNQFDNPILEVTNVDGLLFKGNTINATTTYPQLFADEPAITVKESRNIIFKDNVYNGTATEILRCGDGFETVEFR